MKESTVSFLKYEFVRHDENHRNSLEFIAATGELFKGRQKDLKDYAKQQRKVLKITNLLPLSIINDFALQHSVVLVPFQWEMAGSGSWTIWKVELANKTGRQITELKLEAHDGSLVQMKLKHSLDALLLPIKVW